MKIISLNTWGGKIYEPLLKFFTDNKDIDIFCLQEIYNNAPMDIIIKNSLQKNFNLFSNIERILPDHQGYFRSNHKGYYGLAIFVKKNIKIIKEGDIPIYEVLNYQGGGNHSRNLQFITINKDGEEITIANVHGLWNGKGKTDTGERLNQSKIIKNFMDFIKGDKILCGDFNLEPNTESVKILEEGMSNMIKKYNINSTRTSYYNKPGKFADYVFITKDLEVKDFRVLQDEVSDHCPLLVDIK